MENIQKIIGGAVTGTSLMTGFSYGVSNDKHQQFREPELLNKLINSLLPKGKRSDAYGWFIHYAVGLGFVTAYHQLWKQPNTNPLLKNSLVLGLATGILGASVWTAVLKLHPHAPKINLKRYLPHLVVAHLVFAFFARRGHGLPRDHRPQEVPTLHPANFNLQT
jgi:hypothetical protein